ncbi:MAG: hypothetical protein IKT60_07070, partial [Clostridia bacterium]|nr:hypothetical protein [Clostridia bacterium]
GDLLSKLKGSLTAEDRQALKARGVKLSDQEAVAAYLAEKAEAEAAAEAAAKAAEEEKARLEREANPTAEDLLREIRDLLKQKA